MKKFVTILAAVVMMILTLVPMASASTSTLFVDAPNGGTVNVRTLPAESGKSEIWIGTGFPVTVYGKTDGGWYEVRARVNGKDIYGYIDARYLTGKDPAAKAQRFTAVKKDLTVAVRPSSANGKVNLWPTASKKGDEMRTLAKGEKLTVLAASHAWYQVMDAYGNVGYVAKAYVRTVG